MKMFRLLPVLLPFCMVLSCAPVKQTLSEKTFSADEVLRKVSERNTNLKTLRGDGVITVESLEGSNSGSFDVWLKKPDSLRAEFSGPFGIHVGTLGLTRDKFLFYNWMENHLISGTPDGKTLQSVFRLTMKFEEVLNAFAGEFPIGAGTEIPAKFYVEEGQYVLVYHNTDGTKEFRIDGDEFIITSYRVMDAEGKSIVNAFASRIEETETMPMPTLMRIIFPKDRRSVTISYDDIELNVPVECSVVIPKQAR